MLHRIGDKQQPIGKPLICLKKLSLHEKKLIKLSKVLLLKGIRVCAFGGVICFAVDGAIDVCIYYIVYIYMFLYFFSIIIITL